MRQVVRAADRFVTRTDWLTSWHSFSYGRWYDASNVGFGPLVVCNHDVLAPGAGFDEHTHSGVDLVTYVVSGALLHRDSTGLEAVVRAGEVQVLRSGTGVSHSERNASSLEPVEYVQLWVRSPNLQVRYEPPQSVARWAGLVGPGADLTIAWLPERATTVRAESAARYWYLIEGAMRSTDGTALRAGDAVSSDGDLCLTATEPSLIVWSTHWPEVPS